MSNGVWTNCFRTKRWLIWYVWLTAEHSGFWIHDCHFLHQNPLHFETTWKSRHVASTIWQTLWKIWNRLLDACPFPIFCSQAPFNLAFFRLCTNGWEWWRGETMEWWKQWRCETQWVNLQDHWPETPCPPAPFLGPEASCKLGSIHLGTVSEDVELEGWFCGTEVLQKIQWVQTWPMLQQVKRLSWPTVARRHDHIIAKSSCCEVQKGPWVWVLVEAWSSDNWGRLNQQWQCFGLWWPYFSRLFDGTRFKRSFNRWLSRISSGSGSITSLFCA